MAAAVTYDAEFTADTSQAQQSLKDYKKQIEAVKSATASATRDAKADYQQQMLAARAAGASVEELQKISQKWAQDQLAIKNTNKELTDSILQGNFAALESEEALQKVRQQAIETLKAQTIAVEKLALANKSHGAEVTGSIAGGAAIRLGEGSSNVRAVENFLAKTLGLGDLFQLMFPVVGGLAAIDMLVDVGEKLYDIRTKAVEAASAIASSSNEAHAKALITIDDLAIQADKLQTNIDKLEGHPNNGVALALDNARKMADQLQVSLAADRKELDALLKEHSVGAFGSLISGVAATGTQQKEITRDHKSLEDRVAGINSQFNADAANAKTTDDIKAAGKKRDDAIKAAVQASIDNYRREIKRLTAEQVKTQSDNILNAQYASSQGHGYVGKADDNGAKIANLNAVVSKYQDFLNTQAAQQRVSDLTEKDGALKGAKEGATAAAEAQRKADEAQRKMWEDNFAAFNSGANRSLSEQTNYWIDLANTVQVGSANWLDAIKKSNESLKKENEETHKLAEETFKWREMNNAATMKGILGIIMPGINSDAKGTADNQKALQELSKAQRDVSFSVAESQVQYDLSTDKISKHDAALRLQTLHMQEYAAQLSDLNDQLNAIAENDPESEAKRNQIRSQIASTTGRRDVTAMGDASNVYGSSLESTINNALRGAFNSSIVSASMGQKVSWSQPFKQLGSQIGNAGLNKVEDSVMKGLGFGKVDGSSQASALWVRMAGTGSSSSLEGVGSSLLSRIPFIGSLFGGHAVGGGVEAGETTWVGERGPELATFGSSAYITPNNKLDSVGRGNSSGNTSQVIHVDARGSNDPAATEAAIHRAFGAYSPHIVAASVKAMDDRNQRRPGNGR